MHDLVSHCIEQHRIKELFCFVLSFEPVHVHGPTARMKYHMKLVLRQPKELQTHMADGAPHHPITSAEPTLVTLLHLASCTFLALWAPHSPGQEAQYKPKATCPTIL